MAGGMEDSLLKDGPTESRESIALIQNNPFDLLPDQICDLVFCVLDQSSLRQTRLVCRKWNELALKILSKTPGNVELYFHNENADANKALDQIKMLQSILPFTEYPEMFFNKLTLVDELTREEEDLLQEELGSTLKLLEDFGSTLKSLELREINLSLPILQMLENWCANLEELTLYRITITEDNNTTIQDLETSLIPLKPNLQKFKVLDSSRSPVLKTWIFLIVKSSPNLQVLHVNFIYEQTDFEFWKKMQTLPNITKNLEEVKIETYGNERRIIKELGLLNDVSFSSKLTSLSLTIKDAKFPPEQLSSFIRKVGESLEKLFLDISMIGAHWDDQSYKKIRFPPMKRLKVVELTGHRVRFFNYFEFRIQLPNVEILSVSHNKRSEFVDAFFSNAACYLTLPYKALNTLCIKAIQHSEANFVMHHMLPNLRDLTLELETRDIPEESWFTRIFTGLAEMKKLKILYLYFLNPHTWDRSNLEVCFSALMASESLEDLKIAISRPWPYTADPRNFPPSLEKVMVKIPKLKVLTLKYFNLEKPVGMKLFESLGQKGILLKVEDKPVVNLLEYLNT